MMLPDFVTVLASAFGAFLMACVNFIFNKRASKADALSKEADAKGKDIDNEVKLSEYYKEMLDDLKPRYEQKFADLVTLYESKMKILYDEIALLNRKNKMLSAENTSLRRRIKDLEK